jgi:hypothetical protein
MDGAEEQDCGACSDKLTMLRQEVKLKDKFSLIGIREIRQTQLDMLLYNFIVTLRQHVSTLSRGHHQAVEEVFIKT